MREAAEYEFTMPDGSKRYEIVDLTSEQSAISQCWQFKRMHGATGFRPVKR
jgi:hypothetical protein